MDPPTSTEIIEVDQEDIEQVEPIILNGSIYDAEIIYDGLLSEDKFNNSIFNKKWHSKLSSPHRKDQY